MANFLTAHKQLDVREAGWANDPVDEGGETIFGIARNYWPDWPGWVKLDILKGQPDFPHCAETNPDLISLAGQFFKTHFWDPMRLDDFLSQELASYLYDTAVNFGVEADDISGAPQFLQESLNEMGAQLTVDGKVGPATLSAVKTLAGSRLGCNYLIYAIEHRRIRHRYEKIKRQPDKKRFITNWLCRDLRLPC